MIGLRRDAYLSRLEFPGADRSTLETVLSRRRIRSHDTWGGHAEVHGGKFAISRKSSRFAIFRRMSVETKRGREI